MSALIRILAMAALAIATLSCRETTDGPVAARRVDFSTLISTEPLSFCVEAGGRDVSLRAASGRAPDGVKAGDRLVIEYTTYDYTLAGTDVEIELKAAAIPFQGEIKARSASELRSLRPAQAEIQGAAREGNYLNIQLTATYSGTRRTISAAAEASTLAEPTVRIWLYNSGEPADASAGISRKYYASFSLAALGLSREQRVEVAPITETTFQHE